MNTALILLSLSIAFGKAFDMLSYKFEKKSVYKKMQRWLKAIENAKFKDIHKLSIDYFVSSGENFFPIKRRPILTIIKIMILSFIITSSASIIAFYINGGFNDLKYQKWHDVLPWYPTYIVNFVLDFLTIFMSIIILKFIRKRGFVISILGLLLDFFLAYSFFALVMITVIPTNDFIFKLGAGNQYVSMTPKSKFKQGKTIPINTVSNFEEIGISKKTLKSIFNDGFTNKAFIKQINIDKQSIWVKFSNLYSFESFYNLIIKRNVVERSIKSEIMVFEGENKKNYILNVDYKFSVFIILLSLTTLIPTTLFLLFLAAMYISKKLFQLSKFVMIRVFKSSIDDVDDMNKFNPGVHIGSVIAILICILKLLDEFVKQF